MAKVSDSLDIHELPDLHLRALWALDKLTAASTDRFTASQVATFIVETCGVNTYRQHVKYALEKDPTRCHKNNVGYKLMEPGRKALAALIFGRVVFIESGKPFSTKNVLLRELFQKLTARIDICDPYLDIHTLDLLFKNATKATPIRILTSNVKDNPVGTFTRHLADMRREGFQIDVAKHVASELHDRYIMDDKTFWLSGNSLNHLGNKESFLVALGEDVRQSMATLFSSRWTAATIVR